MWTISLLLVIALFMGLLSVVGFCWAVKSGQFKDIEEAKYQMMREEE
jgi:cbb3-type cytochrome oxidase maturation protein